MERSSSLPALSRNGPVAAPAGNGPVAASAGNGQIAATASQQDESPQIPLLDFPEEIITHILRQTGDPRDLLSLSMACSTTHRIFLGEQQRKKDSMESFISQFEQIKAQDKEAIKKYYYEAWDCLLHPMGLVNQAQASKLMKILLDLLSGMETDHIAELFPHGFTGVRFNWLAKIHLERTLQLACHYFSITEDPTAYDFIWHQCNLDSANTIDANVVLEDMVKAMQLGQYRSFLFCALDKLYEYQNENDQILLYHLFELITCLVQEEADYNTIDDQGNTPLMLACRCHNQELIDFFLNQPNIKLNIKNQPGENALDLAMVHGSLTTIEALIQHQDNVPGEFKEDYNLYYAIRNGDVAGVESTLKSVVLETQTKAFCYAIWKENESIIRTFLEEINDSDDLIKEALHLLLNSHVKEEARKIIPYLINLLPKQERINFLITACGNASVEVVEHLLRYEQFWPKENDKLKAHVLAYAVKHSSAEIVLALLEAEHLSHYIHAFIDAIELERYEISGAVFSEMFSRGNGQFIVQVLEKAIEEQAIPVIKALINNYGSHIRIAHILSILIPAEQSQNTALLKMFLEDTNLEIVGEKDESGNTTDYSSKLVLLIKYLISQGARYQDQGTHALHYAVQRQDPSILQFLLEQPDIDNDINARNRDEESVLDIAIRSGNLLSIQLLLQQQKIDISQSSNQRLSALHFAIEYNDLTRTQSLLSELDKEALISAFNYAIWRERDEIIDAFLKIIDKPRENFIQSALTYAQQHGQAEVVKHLQANYQSN